MQFSASDSAGSDLYAICGAGGYTERDRAVGERRERLTKELARVNGMLANEEVCESKGSCED